MKMRNEFSVKPLYIKGVQVNRIRKTIKYTEFKVMDKELFIKEEKGMTKIVLKDFYTGSRVRKIQIKMRYFSAISLHVHTSTCRQ